MNIICLVDLNKRGMKEIGEVAFLTDANTNFNEVERVMTKYCKMHEKELKDGYWLFIASKSLDGKYTAKYRASYAEWMLEDEEYRNEEPYYIDVAENDEKVMFHLSVN